MEDTASKVFSITASTTKEDVMKKIAEHGHLLSSIPLPEPMTPFEQAQKDFCRERILLNDVPFVPDGTDSNRAHNFANTIKEFISRISGNHKIKTGKSESGIGMRSGGYNPDYKHGTKTHGSSSGGGTGGSGLHFGGAHSSCTAIDHAHELLNTLFRRSCRTSAGVDSFFMVQKLFAVEGTIVTQRPVLCDPPIRIDVFLIPPLLEEDNALTEIDSEISDSKTNISTKKWPLAARIEVHNFFAVYNMSAMDLITGDSEKDPPPWLEVETIVIDKSNFQTFENNRILKLIIFNPATSKYY